MSTPTGLQSALRLYASDKVKERQEGREYIREIFSNRDNLVQFQETASRSGGEGWVAFYQCLFQVVVTEKRAAVKKGASLQVDRRLTEAISLVRWMTERTVPLLSRKPFFSLFTHMTHLLVFAGSIFIPAALDYAKALRSLLSYPPHLAALDANSWKALMGICWGAVLGDELSVEEDWADEEGDPAEDEVQRERKSGKENGTPVPRGKTTISQATIELVTIIPLLLSSSASPLVSPLPSSDAIYTYTPSLGLSLLLKTCRFLAQHSTETSAHLYILRAVNLVLGELELNCRKDFLAGGLKLLPQLIGLWATKNRALREQVIIATRILLPHLLLKTTREKHKQAIVGEAIGKLFDALDRESGLRWGVEGLDMGVIRLRKYEEEHKREGQKPFTTVSMIPGFDFTQDCALTWVILEIYAECCYYLHDVVEAPHTATPRREGTAKRRKVDNAVATLLAAVQSGSHASRLLHLQVLLFLIDRHYADFHAEMQVDIRRVLLEVLDDDVATLQSWTFIALATLAVQPHDPNPDEETSTGSFSTPSRYAARLKTEVADWEKVWSHAIRKMATPTLSRACCHAASTLLRANRVSSLVTIGDIGPLLQHIDVQGPVYPLDSACDFLALALQAARADTSLYAAQLENKVVDWLEKWNALDGMRGKGRMDPSTPGDVVRLLQQCCKFPPLRTDRGDDVGGFPDCAIVERVLEEYHGRDMRDFILHGRIAETSTSLKGKTAMPQSQETKETSTPAFLEGRAKRISTILSRALSTFIVDWQADSGSNTTPSPPERIRRSIDLIVLALAFQAALHVNSIRSDGDCVQGVTQLLHMLIPHLRATSVGLTAERMLWGGFEGLMCETTGGDGFDAGKVLLSAGSDSGVRWDLLPEKSGRSVDETSGRKIILRAVWHLPLVLPAFREVFEICRDRLDAGDGSQAFLTGTPATQQHTATYEDDDFGEIKIADADLIPVSKEATECDRTAASLLLLRAEFPLQAAILASDHDNALTDTKLVNAVLGAEGSRFLQLGQAVCDCVRSGHLRLTPTGFDRILQAIEELLSTYAYGRDESFLLFTLSFLQQTLPIWLAPELRKTELAERAMFVVKFLVAKVRKEQLSSWKARLALLGLVDEYLDYEPDGQLWTELEEQEDDRDMEVDGDQSQIGLSSKSPMAFVQSRLLDPDFRVRFRATTSSAALFTPHTLSPAEQLSTYHLSVAAQPGHPKHFDSFIIDILWKLNCVVVSPHLRPAAIYHLYEIPLSSSDYNGHLHLGLEAVSRRLGLAGVADLYLPHCFLILKSQIQENQPPLRIPAKLYGFPTSKAYSQAVLEVAGAAILALNATSLFDSLCESASLDREVQVKRNFAATAALVFGDQMEEGDGAAVMGTLGLIFGIEASLVEELIKGDIEAVLSRLFDLIDTSSTLQEMAAQLNTVDQKGQCGKLFVTLNSQQSESRIGIEEPTDGTLVALQPSLSTANVLRAYLFLRQSFMKPKSSSLARVVFDALTRLFHLAHATFLRGEQMRYIRAIALVIAFNPEEASLPTTLSTILRELAEMVGKQDTASTALPLLTWGFDRYSAKEDQRVADGIGRTILQLGKAWMNMAGHEGMQGFREEFATWLVTAATTWCEKSWMAGEVTVIAALWPAELLRRVKGLPSLAYDDISGIAKRGGLASLALSGPLLDAEGGQIKDFGKGLFWDLKKGLTKGGCVDTEGRLAFLELLDQGEGGIAAPDEDTFLGDSYEALRNTFGRDPLALLQAVVMSRLTELVRADDYSVRDAALKCLKTLHGSQAISNPSVLRSSADLMGLLVPDMSTAATQTGRQTNLLELSEDDGWIRRSRSFPEWTVSLACLLCRNTSADQAFYSCLIPLLAKSPSTAAELLPVLAQACLIIPAPGSPSKVAESPVQVRSRVLAQYLSAVLVSPIAAVETLQTIINVILHFMMVDPPMRRDPVGYASWVNVDPLLLGEAAIRCGAYATALLFLELAKADWPKGDDLDLSSSRVQKIMYDVYSNVEDPDGFYGIKTHDVKASLVRRLEHEGDHWRAFGMNAAALENPVGRTSIRGATTAAMRDLHHLGFDRTSSALLRANSKAKTQMIEDDPLELELAWRTGDWDVPIQPASKDTSAGMFYAALRAVHRERDEQAALRVVHDAIESQMTRLSELGVERMTEIKSCVEDLLCLKDVAGWLGEEVRKAVAEGDWEGRLLQGFVQLKTGLGYRIAERRLAVRQSLFKASQAREGKNLIGDLTTPQFEGLRALEKACYLRLGKLAREEGNVQAAINAVVAVQALESHQGLKSAAAEDEFGQVLVEMGEPGLAIQHVEELVGKLRAKVKGEEVKTSPDRSRLGMLLGKMANWTSSAKLRAAGEIKHTFDEAYALSKQHHLSGVEQARLCHDYAKFADEHQATLAKSPELERLYAYSQRKTHGATPVNTPSTSRKGKSATKTAQQTQTQEEEDEKEIQQYESELTAYVKLALSMYARAFSYSDEYDDSTTRMVSLWMEYEDREDINRAFKAYLEPIPSYKFIFLGPQLTARLDRPKQPTTFNTCLNALVLKMSRDHPFHVLYQIITLAAGFQPSSKSRRMSDAGAEGRAPAAHEIVALLAADTSRPLAQRAVSEMRVLAGAAVSWSLHKEEKESQSGREMTLPPSSSLASIKSLNIPLPTSPPPIDPTRRYEGVPTLVRYRSKYMLLGGIHKPKRMQALDSNGKTRYEMFKGEDEVRQDAVMEQVFELTNKLLARDRRTKARKLRFRTYVVIPLAYKTGIIEFVGNSKAIGEYLKPAHARYGKRTNDITSDQIRSTLKPIQDKDHTSSNLPKKFAECMKRYHPVMRHFFTEQHSDPMAWLAMRTRYSRSVAVTSMVGWVLGVGDRHCSNILVDMVTGEMVHIDFGIVFEEGRRLRIPEKVGFRLTNDMVDGFGITGVDGTFRRCSELTLRMLRESAGLIMTVLEVFKHDPLYAWTGDPDKLQRAQPGTRSEIELVQQSATVQEKADRVLSRIRQKLRGDLSVEYQVNELIQEARDVENLSKIFIGWQPWL